MDKNILKKVAKLSNLQITDNDLVEYKPQLEETVKYIDNLQELNTSKINPTHHISNVNNVYFTDGQKNLRKLSLKELEKSTKITANKYFITKKIL